MLAIAGFSTSGPIIPFYLQDLGVIDPLRIKFLTGLINALPSLTFAIVAPMWGSLADNYGRKPMLLRAMFGGAVILVLQGFVTNPWQLLALRTFQGCITGTIAAATVLVASIAPPAETGYALGLLQMAVFLGSSLGPMFGGVISDIFSHRVTFLATSALLLLAGIVVTKFAEDDFVPPRNRKSMLKSMVPDFSPLLHSKALWSLMAVVAADQIAGSIVAPFLPLFIQSISPRSGIVSSTTGIVLGVSALASAVAAASLGKLSYRIGYRRTLVVCMVTAAVFTIPQAFVHSPLQLLILRIISCFFIGGDMPAANALIALQIEPGKQGSVYGLTSSISSASNAIGPVLGASLAATLGYRSVFTATGLVLAASGLAIGLFIRHSREPAAR
ncbi:MAG: MFS transporter [Rectinemataceae bacterium]|jgi:DHA1 family multidrug resistance protein-like MFS transporter